ncbi:MAG: winged helix-turn-helix transcriptional regulator [Methanobrevibacter sp.]|uniref:MarR family winged helix-turn-helix transcriptional regulator n=1 Tax=Methanobrevibacter sp. TaxID=66852 RepID=UPI0025F60B0D|nr:MarR family winged helix-turn-helix transcriptional regulator [Methanobrevibacter sp.]MBQ2961435.1 winged helix-turn-helix transcriptional regulator [Methanobrevibacter sp.]MBQ6139479.1 winged helix-turn-helix transcriptional regulator [Methanobrevibacter sp.]
MDLLEIFENFDTVPAFPALNMIIKWHTKFFEDKLEGTNVNPSELPYIIRIGEQNGELTQKDLSNLFLVSEPVVARTLKNLEKKGFIIRSIDQKNKTRRLISLSSKGFEIREKTLHLEEDWCNSLFKVLSEDEKRKFNEILGILAIESVRNYY